MTKISGLLTAIMLASALAMPAAALAQHRSLGGGGGGGGAAVARGGGGPSFHGVGGGHSFSPISSGGGRSAFSSHVGRSFSPHVGRSYSTNVGRSVRYSTVHRGTTFNRSVQRTQNLNRLSRSNATIHTRRNASAQTGTLRHNGKAAITSQAARQGRFGSQFAEHARHDHSHGHTANIAAHRAWRHGWRAGFVAWYGPVFWPYAYSDIFDYAFWPYGYDDGFWFYAYDDLFDGVFWGEYGPPEDYAYALDDSGATVARAPRPSYAGVEELCTQPGTGITAWPFADIERKVALNADQKQLLGDMRKAAADAAATFKSSCPAQNAFPLTPPGRLQAMTARLQAVLDAVKVVRPPLEKFYASLSDEQKERFNQLGPNATARIASKATETTGAGAQDANSCKQPKPGLANLPIERIEEVVKPTDTQQGALKQLQEATDKAVSALQAACPDDTPLTPPGRLQAMEKRLQAMIEAANTVKPALDSFYSSLSSEQKARFNRIGRELAQNND